MEDSVGTRCAFTDLMKHGIVAIDRRVVPDPRNRFANLYRRCKRELLWIILIQKWFVVLWSTFFVLPSTVCTTLCPSRPTFARSGGRWGRSHRHATRIMTSLL